MEQPGHNDDHEITNVKHGRDGVFGQGMDRIRTWQTGAFGKGQFTHSRHEDTNV